MFNLRSNSTWRSMALREFSFCSVHDSDKYVVSFALALAGKETFRLPRAQREQHIGHALVGADGLAIKECRLLDEENEPNPLPGLSKTQLLRDDFFREYLH